MERIRGKHSLTIDARALTALSRRYADILIDIGTGDGHFVRRVADTSPGCLAIGIDACRDNLRETSRRAPENALYLIANALALPPGLSGLATRVTINFPWGSLLAGLLDSHACLMNGLSALGRPGTPLEVRLNAGALTEEGWGLEDGAERIAENLSCTGFDVTSPSLLDIEALRLVGTTWAKRLAGGRDPRATHLDGVYCPESDRRGAKRSFSFERPAGSIYGSA